MYVSNNSTDGMRITREHSTAGADQKDQPPSVLVFLGSNLSFRSLILIRCVPNFVSTMAISPMGDLPSDRRQWAWAKGSLGAYQDSGLEMVNSSGMRGARALRVRARRTLG